MLKLHMVALYLPHASYSLGSASLDAQMHLMNLRAGTESITSASASEPHEELLLQQCIPAAHTVYADAAGYSACADDLLALVATSDALHEQNCRNVNTSLPVDMMHGRWQDMPGWRLHSCRYTGVPLTV